MKTWLKPYGFLYIDEYVGPSRHEWSPEHLIHAREFFERLEPAWHLNPLNYPLDYSDPSEMVQSSRIFPAIYERFAVVHYRPYWGNLLFPILSHLRPELVSDERTVPVVEQLIAAERDLVAQNAFSWPLFAVVLAQSVPK